MLKKTLIIIIAPIFTTLLFASAWTYGINKTIGTPEPVKKTLNDSGIYSSVVAGLLDQAKKNVGSDGSDVPLTNDIVKNAANASFTPQVLQENTEKFLDSTYKWLNGAGDTPDFKLDLSGVKTSFANNVSSSLQTQLAALPTCPSSIRTDDFDAFTAVCLPKGTTATTAANEVKANLLSGKGFLDNPVITANDVKSGDKNTSIFSDQLKKAPDYFAWAKKAPFIFVALAALMGGAIVLLSSTRASGIRKVSFTLIFVGVGMLIFAWVANYLVTQKALPKINISNLVLQEKVQILAKDLTQEINRTYWIFGGIYTTLGVVGLLSPTIAGKIGSRNGKKSKTSDKLASFGEKPVEHKPTEPADTSATEDSKPAEKKKITIQ